VALLAATLLISTPLVMAQDDGTSVPQPPSLKRRSAPAPDADFQSPLKGEGFQAGAQGGDDGSRQERLRELLQRRRQLRNSGQFGGQAPGGSENGFAGGGARGGGPGFAGGTAGGGFGGGQGFGALGGRAGGMRGGMQMGIPGSRRPLDLTSLNLSEEQKQRIRDMRQASKERAHDARQLVLQRQRELHELLFSADAPDAKIRQTRHQLRQAQEAMDDINMENLLGIRRVLTAEQRQKLPGLAPPAPGTALGPRGGPTLGQRPGAGFGQGAGFGGNNGGFGQGRFRQRNLNAE